MKVLSGHLTAHDKKVINLIQQQNAAIFRLGRNLGCWRVNKADYHFSRDEKGIFTVRKQVVDRGLIPCPGSELRLSTYTSTFSF